MPKASEGSECRMGIFLIIVFLAASCATLVALFRRLQRWRRGAGWWVALAVLVIVGAALGVWCGFFCEYHMGAKFRIGGFPIPVVFFHWEDGGWVDFPVPEFQARLAGFTDILAVIAMTTLPLWAGSWWCHRREIRKD